MKIYNLSTNQSNKYLNNKLRFRQQNTITNSKVMFGNNNNEEKNKKRKQLIIGGSILLTAAAIAAAVWFSKGKKTTKATASGTSDNLPKSKSKGNNTEVPPKNITQKNNTTNITKETNKSGDNVTQIIQTPKAKVTTNEIKNNAVSLVQPDVDLTETEENKVVVYNPKNIIKKDFLDFIAVEKKGYEIIAKELNGVLITGKSKEARDEMVNWIIRESGVYNEKVIFDKNKPLESLQQILEKARHAETVFPTSNIRTIVYVENLDDFLADQSSENRKKIAKWNRFAEHVSEQYHTTILFQSDKPEKLEAASVAPHRVGLEVNLDLEYTEADKKEEEK